MLRGARAPFPIAPSLVSGFHSAGRARDAKHWLIVCGNLNPEMILVTGVSSYPPLFPKLFQALASTSTKDRQARVYSMAYGSARLCVVRKQPCAGISSDGEL